MLVIIFLTLGCQRAPYTNLYTTKKPQSTNIVGSYRLTSQTLTSNGLAALQGMTCLIELKADGKFLATNIPPKTSFSSNFFDSLSSGSGEWSIDGIGLVGKQSKTWWGLRLDPNFDSPGLISNKPPYGLMFIVGDPDDGQVLFFQRTK